MDIVRSVIAHFAIIVYPPILIFWFLVHPFVDFWRRRGPALTYTLTLAVIAGSGAVIFYYRKPILAVDYGYQPVLAVLAGLLLVAGLAIDYRCRRQLKLSTLIGLPELRPDHSPEKSLLTGGIYGRMRHPRYSGAMLGLFAVALFVNYLAVYVLALIFLPGIYAVSALEEKELIDRFGDEYREYRKRVPRFVPKGSK